MHFRLLISCNYCFLFVKPYLLEEHLQKCQTSPMESWLVSSYNCQLDTWPLNTNFLPKVSDSCHLKTATDESGPQINCMLHEQFESITVTNIIVPDEMTAIEGILKYFSDDLKLHCVLTTGGTGEFKFVPEKITRSADQIIPKVLHQETLHLKPQKTSSTRNAHSLLYEWLSKVLRKLNLLHCQGKGQDLC